MLARLALGLAIGACAAMAPLAPAAAATAKPLKVKVASIKEGA